MYSFEINILCDHCDGNGARFAEVFTSSPLPSADTEAAKNEAREEGWLFGGDAAVCPTCVEMDKKKR